MIFDSEVITSRNNQFVKWASSLADKKNRKESGYFIAEGVKLTKEAFEAGLPIDYCIVSENKKNFGLDFLYDFKKDLRYEKCRIITVSESVFEKISTEKAPQGVISVIKHLDFFRDMDIIYKEEFFLKPEEKAIFLFSVRDPSNLGAVIRSSVAFGTDHVILSKDCADIYNPKTVRSAMGSLFRVKVTTVNDVVSFIKSAKENSRRVFAAELTDNATSLSDIDLRGSDIVMIGNEGHGIDKEISAICDGSVYIPISKKTESLNASVAAAIFMWEQSK
jgi:TrmH family RNA methyltransferase